MKKILLLIVLLSSAVLAVNSCEDYLVNAQSYPEDTYPWYFGVGQEYMSAAECYEMRGETVADQYFGDGATYFISATTFLVEGGDYLLRGRAYERAADAYLKIGNSVGAGQYYDLAMEQYELCDCKGEIATLSAKLSPIESNGYIFVIGIIGAIIVFILALFIVRRKGSYEANEWTRPSLGKTENTTSTTSIKSSSTYARPLYKPPQRAASSSNPLADAREKMRRRIRERYKLE